MGVFKSLPLSIFLSRVSSFPTDIVLDVDNNISNGKSTGLLQLLFNSNAADSLAYKHVPC